MQMIDVLKKLQEISDKSPEEIGRAVESLQELNTPPVAEGIEIKTSGEDAILAQILKLAGMVGGENSPDLSATPTDTPSGDIGMDTGIEAPMATSGDAAATSGDAALAGPVQPLDSIDVDFLDDDIDNPSDRPYPNSPHEKTHPMNAAVPAGNDLSHPKATYPKVAGGDNPTHIAISYD